jgi:hypothetical protein
MTKMPPIRADNITGDRLPRRKSVLTEEQVFRLFCCAIKDDEELVNEVIEQMYENIIAFDYKRANCIIQLIIERSVMAKWAFRSLLKDHAHSRRSHGTAGIALFTAKPEACGDRQVLARSGVAVIGAARGDGRSMNSRRGFLTL